MLSPKNFLIGVALASAMLSSSIVDTAAKKSPSMLAQMTPSVCWETCSTSCEQTNEKCTTEAMGKPDQLAGCHAAVETCRDKCRDQCGIKK